MSDTNEIVLLFQLDAFRHDYLNAMDTPFLWSLSQKGIVARLQPTFGFEPDAAYIAGLYPDEADGGAQFWYDPERSPFKIIGSWTAICNALPRVAQRVLRKGVELMLRRKSHSPTFSTAAVPFELLHYFDFPMKVRMDQPGFCRGQTIFDCLRTAGKQFFFHGMPVFKVNIESVVSRVRRDLHPPYVFAFLHVGDLDQVGHMYGPDTQERKTRAQRVDRGVEEIYRVAKQRFSEVHILAMGDHGMMAVKELIDVEKVLRGIDAELRRDYLVFLDSTIARFWFFNQAAKGKIIEVLKSLQGGHVMTQEEKDRYHLNYSHNRFGDFFFLVDPGVLIFPNYYQRFAPVKGMHGYAPEYPQQQSACIISSPRSIKNLTSSGVIDMPHLYAAVIELFNDREK